MSWLDRPAWMTSAACAGLDPNVFHPERGEKFPDAIQALCWSCSVREHCLTFALTLSPAHGWWGGLSPKQRARLRARGEVRVHDGWAMYDPEAAEVVFVTDVPAADPGETMTAVLDWLTGPARVSA